MRFLTLLMAAAFATSGAAMADSMSSPSPKPMHSGSMMKSNSMHSDSMHSNKSSMKSNSMHSNSMKSNHMMASPSAKPSAKP